MKPLVPLIFAFAALEGTISPPASAATAQRFAPFAGTYAVKIRRVVNGSTFDGTGQATFQKLAHGTASVPELLASLAEGPENVKTATAALAAVASEYWTAHLPDREAAVRVLYTLLQDPDPERVEAAAAVLPKIPPGSAKSL